MRAFAWLGVLVMSASGCCKCVSGMTEVERVPEKKKAFVGNWVGEQAWFELTSYGKGFWRHQGKELEGNAFVRDAAIHLDVTDLFRDVESLDIAIDREPWEAPPVTCLKLDGRALVKTDAEALRSAHLIGTWRGDDNVLTIDPHGWATWQPTGKQPLAGAARIAQPLRLELRTCDRLVASFPLEQQATVKAGAFVIVLAGIALTRDEPPENTSGGSWDD